MQRGSLLIHCTHSGVHRGTLGAVNITSECKKKVCVQSYLCWNCPEPKWKIMGDLAADFLTWWCWAQFGLQQSSSAANYLPYSSKMALSVTVWVVQCSKSQGSEAVWKSMWPSLTVLMVISVDVKQHWTPASNVSHSAMSPQGTWAKLGHSSS